MTAVEPFFSKDDAHAGHKRILLLSYHFPPDSSMGALRWEKMIATGAERGWRADVISMPPSDAHGYDATRLDALPPGTRLFGLKLDRHPWLEVERLVRNGTRRSPARAVRATNTRMLGRAANNHSPDHIMRRLRRSQLAWLYYAEWRNWCRKAVRLGRSLVAQHHHDVVVSSGPPQMAHHAAWQIADATGRPFVMDLRDTWHGPSAAPEDVASRTWQRLSAHYERTAVQHAALVVANTPAIEGILRERYPEARDRITTVMNGADEDARGITPLPNRFVMLHAGELYNGRNPRPLMRGLSKATRELGVTPDQLRLVFLGDDQFEGVPLAELAHEEGVSAFTTIEKRVPRTEAIRAQGEAAMLVVLQQNLWECVPGKIFEYVQKSSWVLAITKAGTAVESLMRGTNADLVDPQDTDAIARAIVRRYREFAAGVRPQPVNADGRFNRSIQSAKMFDALDQLVKAR